MLDPSSTKVLGRRVVAGLIDFLTVSLLAAYFANTQSEKFSIVERSAEGDPVWSSADFERIQSYADGFNRAQEFGDTLHVFDFLDVFLITLVTTLLALLSKVLIPANTGWSLGQRLLGLRVIDGTGENPTVAGHLSRMWPAIVDVLPVILPGLVGWLIAGRSVHTQRIGDKVANTYVIARKSEPRMLKQSNRPSVNVPDDPAPPAMSAPAALRPDVAAVADPAISTPRPLGEVAAGGATAAGTGSVIASGLVEKFNRGKSATTATSIDGLNVDGSKIKDLSADLPVRPDPDEPSPLPPPIVDAPAVDAPTADSPAMDTPAVDTPSFEAPSLDTPVIEETSFETPAIEPKGRRSLFATRSNDSTSPTAPQPEVTEPSSTAPAPARDAGSTKPPPPNHRSSSRPNPYPKPQPSHRANPATAASPADDATPAEELASHVEASGDLTPTDDASASRHRVERSNWDEPVAEPAPVWSPVDPAAATTVVPTNTEAAVIAPADSAASHEADSAVQHEAVQHEAVQDEAIADPSLEPQWNEEWGAWMFWDEAQNCWLRHDTDNDLWVRVEQ